MQILLNNSLKYNFLFQKYYSTDYPNAPNRNVREYKKKSHYSLLLLDIGSYQRIRSYMKVLKARESVAFLKPFASTLDFEMSEYWLAG